MNVLKFTPLNVTENYFFFIIALAHFHMQLLNSSVNGDLCWPGQRSLAHPALIKDYILLLYQINFPTRELIKYLPCCCRTAAMLIIILNRH